MENIGDPEHIVSDTYIHPIQAEKIHGVSRKMVNIEKIPVSLLNSGLTSATVWGYLLNICKYR